MTQSHIMDIRTFFSKTSKTETKEAFMVIVSKDRTRATLYHRLSPQTRWEDIGETEDDPGEDTTATFDWNLDDGREIELVVCPTDWKEAPTLAQTNWGPKTREDDTPLTNWMFQWE